MESSTTPFFTLERSTDDQSSYDQSSNEYNAIMMQINQVLMLLPPPQVLEVHGLKVNQQIELETSTPMI